MPIVAIPKVSRLTDLAISRLYVVEGNSMEPTFRSGDYLLVNRRVYHLTGPSRSDVVIVRDPRDRSRGDSANLKRVVGLPGEELRLREGTLFIDGDHLVEPYLGGLPATLGLDGQIWQLSDGEYFVMGDNRAHSMDSREVGPVHVRLIVGKAWFRCWPLSRWGAISE